MTGRLVGAPFLVFLFKLLLFKIIRIQMDCSFILSGLLLTFS